LYRWPCPNAAGACGIPFSASAGLRQSAELWATANLPFNGVNGGKPIGSLADPANPGSRSIS
jgi:hypothetical protein